MSNGFAVVRVLETILQVLGGRHMAVKLAFFQDVEHTAPQCGDAQQSHGHGYAPLRPDTTLHHQVSYQDHGAAPGGDVTAHERLDIGVIAGPPECFASEGVDHRGRQRRLFA